MADVLVNLECVQLAITDTRKLPAYDDSGRAIGYSSEETAATATFVVIGDLPVTVAVAMDEHGNPSIPEMVKVLHVLVGKGVQMVADVKAVNGVKLPKPINVDTREKGL